MKIGIISSIPRTGKSTVMLSLGYTFSRSQRKKVALFSTGSLEHIVSPLMQTQEEDEANSVGVFRAMLETRSINGPQLFDYAIRGGRDEVFIFDLFDKSKDINKTMEFLCSTIRTIQSDMVLVEIAGDLNAQGNKEVMAACDVLLYVFMTDLTSISAMKAYSASLDDKAKAKTVYVCDAYDQRILSEKKLSGLTQKGQREVQCIGYSPSMIKLFIDGDLSGFADKVVGGHEDFVKLRSQQEKLMQVLYDDAKRKRIIPIKDWAAE